MATARTGSVGGCAVSNTEGQSTPKVYSAPDLMRLQLPEPRFAVPGLIAEGLSVLGGKPKLGKSWAALSLAIAISQGAYAFGSIPVDQGDALYLALEDTERRLMERLGSLLGSESVPTRLNLSFDWPKLNQGGLDF